MPRQPHHYPVEGPDLGRVPVSAAGVEKYGACARCTGTGRLEVCQTTTLVNYTCPDCQGRGHNPAPECAHGIHHEDPCADCAVDGGGWRWSEAGELERVPVSLTPEEHARRRARAEANNASLQHDGDIIGPLLYGLDATEECPSCGRARTGKTCTGCGTELVE